MVNRVFAFALLLALTGFAQTGLTPGAGGAYKLQWRGYDIGRPPQANRVRIQGDLYAKESRFMLSFVSQPQEGRAVYPERFLLVELKSPPRARQTYRVGDPLDPKTQAMVSFIDDRGVAEGKGKSWGGFGTLTVTAVSRNSVTLEGRSLQMRSRQHGNFVVTFTLRVDQLRRN